MFGSAISKSPDARPASPVEPDSPSDSPSGALKHAEAAPSRLPSCWSWLCCCIPPVAQGGDGRSRSGLIELEPRPPHDAKGGRKESAVDARGLPVSYGEMRDWVRKLVFRHCAASMCAENPMFLAAVDWCLENGITDEVARYRYKCVHDTFLVPDAEFVVNLPSHMYGDMPQPGDGLDRKSIAAALAPPFLNIWALTRASAQDLLARHKSAPRDNPADPKVQAQARAIASLERQMEPLDAGMRRFILDHWLPKR